MIGAGSHGAATIAHGAIGLGIGSSKLFLDMIQDATVGHWGSDFLNGFQAGTDRRVDARASPGFVGVTLG